MLTYTAIASLWTVISLTFLSGHLIRVSLVAALYLIMFAINLSLNAVLRALGKYLAAALISMLDRSVVLLVVASLYLARSLGVAQFLLAMTAGSAAASIAGFCVLRVTPWTVGQAHPLRSLYRKSIHLGASGLATDLNVLETPLVTIGAGVVASGYYGAASRLVGPFAFPASGGSAVIMRQISPNADRARAAGPALRSQLYIVGAVSVALSAAALFGDYIVPAVFGGQFSGTAVAVFRILCVTTAISVLSQLLYASLIALREERRAAVCQWITVPLGLGLTLAGASLGGAIFAVIGGMTAQSVQAVWMAIAVRSTINRVPTKKGGIND